MANFQCAKCGNTSYEVGEMHVAGGLLGKLFDVEGRKFTSVTCTRCRLTEFYKADRSQLSSIFDLFIS
ncbi:MAG: zinc ribbon domain-containing protein [Dokdonella sp.]